MSSSPATEPPRRRLSARQAETVQRLASATVDELRETSFDGLTVRNVARRAGVSPATAYTYFTSKEHLVAEVFWRRLDALPPVRGDVGDALADLALLVADEPELASACTSAVLAGDPEVWLLRDRIGAAFRRRLRDALGRDADPAVLRTLELVLSGALLQAGMGHVAYEDLPGQLRTAAARIAGAGGSGTSGGGS